MNWAGPLRGAVEAPQTQTLTLEMIFAQSTITPLRPVGLATIPIQNLTAAFYPPTNPFNPGPETEIEIRQLADIAEAAAALSLIGE